MTDEIEKLAFSQFLMRQRWGKRSKFSLVPSLQPGRRGTETDKWSTAKKRGPCRSATCSLERLTRCFSPAASLETSEYLKSSGRPGAGNDYARVFAGRSTRTSGLLHWHDRVRL